MKKLPIPSRPTIMDPLERVEPGPTTAREPIAPA